MPHLILTVFMYKRETHLTLTKHLPCDVCTMPRVPDEVTITHDSEKHNEKKGEGWMYLEIFNSSCDCAAMPDKVTRTDDAESL